MRPTNRRAALAAGRFPRIAVAGRPGCGGGDRTRDLLVMSQASYLCSTQTLVARPTGADAGGREKSRASGPSTVLLYRPRGRRGLARRRYDLDRPHSVARPGAGKGARRGMGDGGWIPRILPVVAHDAKLPPFGLGAGPWTTRETRRSTPSSRRSRPCGSCATCSARLSIGSAPKFFARPSMTSAPWSVGSRRARRPTRGGCDRSPERTNGLNSSSWSRHPTRQGDALRRREPGEVLAAQSGFPLRHPSSDLDTPGNRQCPVDRRIQQVAKAAQHVVAPRLTRLRGHGVQTAEPVATLMADGGASAPTCALRVDRRRPRPGDPAFGFGEGSGR